MLNQEQASETRRPYAPPRLTEYGTIQDLTQGGTMANLMDNTGIPGDVMT